MFRAATRVRKLLVIFPMLPLPVITSKLPVTLPVILPMIRYILCYYYKVIIRYFQCLRPYEVGRRLLTFTCRFCVCSKQLQKLLTHQRRRNVQKSGTAYWRIQKARLGGPGWGAKGVEVRGTKGSDPRRRSRRRSGEWGMGFPLPSRLGSLGEQCELPSGVRGRAPAENRFQCFPSVTEFRSLRCFSQSGVLSQRRFSIENNSILWLTWHNQITGVRSWCRQVTVNSQLYSELNSQMHLSAPGL